MEREPDALIDQCPDWIGQYLDWEYRKALAEGIAPVFLSDGKAWDCRDELEETFPDEP